MDSYKSFIIFLIVFPLFACSSMITPGNSIFAGENEKTIVLNERVGEVIDREERDYFRMFQSYDEFESAVFLELPDGSYVAEVTYEQNGEKKGHVYRIVLEPLVVLTAALLEELDMVM